MYMYVAQTWYGVIHICFKSVHLVYILASTSGVKRLQDKENVAPKVPKKRKTNTKGMYIIQYVP